MTWGTLTTVSLFAPWFFFFFCFVVFPFLLSICFRFLLKFVTLFFSCIFLPFSLFFFPFSHMVASPWVCGAWESFSTWWPLVPAFCGRGLWGAAGASLPLLYIQYEDPELHGALWDGAGDEPCADSSSCTWERCNKHNLLCVQAMPCWEGFCREGIQNLLWQLSSWGPIYEGIWHLHVLQKSCVQSKCWA